MTSHPQPRRSVPSSASPLPSAILASCFALSLPAFSGEETRPPVEPAVPSPAARVVGDVPDGTPPPPAQPAPRLVFQPEDILSTHVVETANRQVVFQKVAPVALRPIPVPVPIARDEEEIAAIRETLRKEPRHNRLVFLGASVYEDPSGKEETLSFFRLWPTPDSPPVSLWARVNAFRLTGFADFEMPDGDRRSMILMASHGHRERPATHFPLPSPEAFAGASHLIVEGNPTAEELAPVEALIALCNHPVEGPRLQAAYESRLAAAEQRARELRENPPEKKTLVIQYWRADRAGRSGAAPKPAVIR